MYANKNVGIGQLGQGDTFANIMNTPQCSFWDTIWMSQGCYDAVEANFYGTSTAITPVVPTIGAPTLTQTGVGVNVPGNDYSAVVQDLSDAQVSLEQQLAASAIDSTPDDSDSVWYLWIIGGLAAFLVIEQVMK